MEQRENIEVELKVDLILLLGENGYPPYTEDEVYNEIFEQAKNTGVNLNDSKKKSVMITN